MDPLSLILGGAAAFFAYKWRTAANETRRYQQMYQGCLSASGATGVPPAPGGASYPPQQLPVTPLQGFGGRRRVHRTY